MQQAHVNTQESCDDDMLSQAFLKDVETATKPLNIVMATLTISVLSLALPVMTLQIYDRVLPNPGTGTLPALIVGVCVAIILEAMLRVERSYIVGWNAANFEHRLSCRAMDHMLSSDYSYLRPYGVGDYLHRMSAIAKIKEFHDGYALMVFVEMATLPLFLGLIFYIGGIQMALVPVLVLCLFAVVQLHIGEGYKKALDQRDTADDKRFNFLIEGLEGIHALKAMAIEDKMQRRYEDLLRESVESTYNVTQMASRTFNLSAVFYNILVALIIVAGALFVLGGSMTTGALIATILLAGRMMQPVQRALGLWARYQDYQLAKQKVEEIFKTPAAANQGQAVEDMSGVMKEGRLELHDVSFSYGHDDHDLIENLSLHLEPGEALLIKGGHGSGKTALMELMAGICPPRKGEIIIDGHPLNAYERTALYRHVGYIPTVPVMFNGTIRDNLTCFGQIDHAKVLEIARLMDVDVDVMALPAGYDTRVGTHDVDPLSLSLKQRIAIVRALAFKPRLVLLDGADRVLDKQGYDKFYKLLAQLKGRATLVMICEDQNIMALADHVFDMATHEKGPNVTSVNEYVTYRYRELPL